MMEIKHKKFKPFDKVLVKDCRDIWQIDLYSYWDTNYNNHYTMSYGGGLNISDNDILPYEGNERLLGTTNDPYEEIELEKMENNSQPLFTLTAEEAILLRYALGDAILYCDKYSKEKDSVKYSEKYMKIFDKVSQWLYENEI